MVRGDIPLVGESLFDPESLRVLVFLNSEREAQASAKTLTVSGVDTRICAGVVELAEEIRNGAGALLISSAAVSDQRLLILTEALAGQPSWSHMPIVVLLGSGEVLTTVDPAFHKLETLGNVTLLEGPVRLSTLVSTIRASIAYRRRQYQQRDLLAELEQSRREAVEANRAKSDFLANMSHEIRTPLGAVVGFSELLMETGISEKDKSLYMTTIRRNGQLLSALIDDILDLAKVESGRIEIENMEFSMPELIGEILSSLEPLAVRKGLYLRAEKMSRRVNQVRTDPIRLKQVLTNIVSNAIKFTSVGGVSLRWGIAPKTGVGQGACLTFQIEDSGIGISVGQRERLFRPFTQADTSTTRRFGGTGLGLVLAKKLAQALGGDLELTWSTPGVGSCFTINIDAEIMAREDSENVSANNEDVRANLDATQVPLAGRRILVVDDSLDNQVLIGRTLRLLGAQIDLAGDGEEAVTKALAGSFDVVLMDLQMPRLGGVEATRILREKGYQRPIVALTAHALKEDRLRCLRVGCTDYLTKPIQRAHLVSVLDRVARAHDSST